MGNKETGGGMADRLAGEAKRIAQMIGAMQREREEVLGRADALTADILRAQGALEQVKKLAEDKSDEGE